MLISFQKLLSYFDWPVETKGLSQPQQRSHGEGGGGTGPLLDDNYPLATLAGLDICYPAYYSER